MENISKHHPKFLGVLKYSGSFTFKCNPTKAKTSVCIRAHVFILRVCVLTAFACVCDLARLCACVFVHICAYRTPLWWFSRCWAAGWCTPQSRLPVSCAARGNFWSQPSLWSCSSTKMWMCSTHTRLSCICRPGATRTQVCWKIEILVTRYPDKVLKWVPLGCKWQFSVVCLCSWSSLWKRPG